MSKVILVDSDFIDFDTGHRLLSEHTSDCCEHHYLSMANLDVRDFEGMDFDLDRTDFFERVEDFGIRLVATNGYAIPIPGYGSNNGYYSSDLNLVVIDADGKTVWDIDISECQEISG